MEDKEITLYSYWRSSCSYRLRIALNIKKIAFKYEAINLLQGEHKTPEYLARNPQGQVPTLQVDDINLCDSVAIMHYLNKVVPEPRLEPENPIAIARMHQIINIIAGSIQPVQNLSVLQKIEALGGDKMQWAKDTITNGFKSIESILQESAGEFCIGSEISIADICLVPQVYNAARFSVDMDEFPKLKEVYERLVQRQEFIDAHPDKMPDAPEAASLN